MTKEELVQRLREPTYYTHPTTEDGRLAAARIEELEAKLAKAVRGLKAISVWGEDTYARDMARTTLAEIEGN